MTKLYHEDAFGHAEKSGEHDHTHMHEHVHTHDGTTHVHTHSHVHEAGHDHVHTQEELHEEDKSIKTLAVLLDHWVEHNSSHMDGYVEWAEKARALGAGDVADEISEAVRFMKDSNDALARAGEAIKKYDK